MYFFSSRSSRIRPPLSFKQVIVLLAYAANLYVNAAGAATSNRSGPPQPSEECLKASRKCEGDTDCIHRLAVLQSACVTNTCQPQCREAALNLYQNRDGRQLLRTDATCVPGRYELEKCGFLPNKSPKHCSFAKLICETDLQCNAKWEVFISECEAETNEGRCPDKCKKQLNATLSTSFGGALADCTCTDKEDNRCIQLREISLRSCLSNQPSDKNTLPLPRPGHSDTMDRPTTSHEEDNTGDGQFDGNALDHSTPDSAHTSLPALGALIFSFLSFVFARHCLFA